MFSLFCSEVQIISSHTYVVDRPGTLGVRAGLSQLVANMLESVYHMWKLHLSPDLVCCDITNNSQFAFYKSFIFLYYFVSVPLIFRKSPSRNFITQ